MKKIKNLQNHKMHGNGTKLTRLFTASVYICKESDQLRDTGLKQTKGCDLMYSAEQCNSQSEDNVDAESIVV